MLHTQFYVYNLEQLILFFYIFHSKGGGAESDCTPCSAEHYCDAAHITGVTGM